jgi:RimJ/RimL family protein N-acetyltransferase
MAEPGGGTALIQTSLYEGKTIQLTAVDLEQDLKIESGWTYNLDYARHYRETPLRPIAVHELKKYYEKLFKDSLEGRRHFHFAVRLKADRRLVGFVRLSVMEWSHGVGRINVATGETGMRKEVEPEALQLALVYAFDELNLHRVAVSLPEYDHLGVEILEQAGFQLEVRRKECFYRTEHYWDWLQYGMLRSEWQGGGQL